MFRLRSFSGKYERLAELCVFSSYSIRKTETVRSS